MRRRNSSKNIASFGYDERERQKKKENALIYVSPAMPSPGGQFSERMVITRCATGMVHVLA